MYIYIEKASQRGITNAKGVDKIFYKRSSPNKPHIQPLKGKRSSHHQYIFKFKSPTFLGIQIECISPHEIQRSIKRAGTITSSRTIQRMLLS